MKNEHKIDPISMHDDREKRKRKFGKTRGPLERGPRPLERGLPAELKFSFQIFCRGGYFWSLFARLLDILYSLGAVVFSLFSLSNFFFVFSFVFFTFCLSSSRVASFNPFLLALRLPKSVKFCHEKSPASPRHQSLRYEISDPWIRPKLARLKLFYLL